MFVIQMRSYESNFYVSVVNCRDEILSENNIKSFVYRY